MNFIKIYIVVFISLSPILSMAQFEKDSIIITKEHISITFTNKNTITDLSKIKQELSKIGVRLSYSLMEVDENKYLKRLSAKIVYPDQTFESIYQYELNDTNSIGFYKISKAKNEIKHESRELLDYYKNDSIKRQKVDFAATHKACKNIKKEKVRIKCTSQKIQKYVSKNFNVKVARNIGLSAGKKNIFVMFVIDKNGKIQHVDARAPHPALEKEAIRVVNSLPKMIPAIYNKKTVDVKYALPITFYNR